MNRKIIDELIDLTYDNGSFVYGSMYSYGVILENNIFIKTDEFFVKNIWCFIDNATKYLNYYNYVKPDIYYFRFLNGDWVISINKDHKCIIFYSTFDALTSIIDDNKIEKFKLLNLIV
jgi:hypothetical protein